MFDIPFKVDLARGLQKTILRQVLATEDNLAHTFHIACTRNDSAEDLTGATVTGYFIRADEATISLAGSVSGNVVSVTLDSSCYSVTGRCYIVVKVKKGDAITTVFWAEGAVSMSQTDVMVATEGTTLKLEELFARLEAAEAEAAEAAENATTAADAAIAAQASIEASREIVNAAAAAVSGAQEAADRANAAAEAVKDLDVSALEAQINAVQAAVMPTALWSGDWSNGNITVPGIGDWLLLGIQTGLGFIVGINSGGNIRASGILGNAGTHITVNLSMTVSGSTVTMGINSRYTHTASGNHGSDNTTTVKGIIGLLKMGTLTIQE